MNDSYHYEVHGITFDVDRVRSERHELVGEINVKYANDQDKTINGYLNVSYFNFSSLRARQDRARHLANRSISNGAVDWFGFLEDLCQKVHQAEREGNPAVDLRTLPRPERDDELKIDGLGFPRRHA